MFFRTKKSGSRSYLQIVENRWENGRSRQRVVTTLGRLDQLQESGQLDALLVLCQTSKLGWCSLGNLVNVGQPRTALKEMGVTTGLRSSSFPDFAIEPLIFVAPRGIPRRRSSLR